MNPIDRPLFIIGPPRCGKKMTADVLLRHPDIAAFDYEMNFLWRYGHAAFPHDQLQPPQLNTRIRNYIVRAFEKKLKRDQKKRIVDRTDHNIVRVDYVQAVFPDALFILLVRDPRPAIASAMKRRQEKRGFRPYWEKAQGVPLRDLPYYAAHYAWDILQARLGRGYKELWGIRTPEILRVRGPQYSLAQKCAVQWAECMRHGLEAKDRLPQDRFFVLRYEEAVERPQEVFQSLFRFAGLSWPSEITAWLKQNIKKDSRQNWRNTLDDQALQDIKPWIASWQPFFDTEKSKAPLNRHES